MSNNYNLSDSNHTSNLSNTAPSPRDLALSKYLACVEATGYPAIAAKYQEVITRIKDSIKLFEKNQAYFTLRLIDTLKEGHLAALSSGARNNELYQERYQESNKIMDVIIEMDRDIYKLIGKVKEISEDTARTLQKYQPALAACENELQETGYTLNGTRLDNLMEEYFLNNTLQGDHLPTQDL